MKKNLQQGQAVILSIMLLVLISTVIVVRGAGPTKNDAQFARQLFDSNRSALVAESSTEDVTYRVRKALTYDSTETLQIDGFWATTTTVDDPVSGIKTVASVGSVQNSIRKKTVSLMQGDQVNFNFGIQTGTGGISMANSSKVQGNVYSNGPVSGSSNNDIKGSVVSAGASGSVSGIHSTSSVYSHSISNSNVDGDAYYYSAGTISNTTVLGTRYPGSQDKSTTTFPISDDQIAQWESDAEAGGVINSPCPYVISASTTLGPKKINCDMQLKGTTLNVTGPLWIVGNLSFTNSCHLVMSGQLNGSVMLIADKAGDQLVGSNISVGNSCDIKNNGHPGTAIYLISANKSAESGGANSAIDMNNSVSNDAAVYSNHGLININQSGKLYMATGYKLSLAQSAQIVYNTGIADSTFNTGPGGSWNILSWKETQ